VVIIHFHWTELHQIIIVFSPLQLLYKAIPIFQWIWKCVARSANRPVTFFDAATLCGTRLPEFETVEKVDFRSRFLRKQYEMNVFSLYYVNYEHFY
jgi:hypothetical protein